MKRSLLLSATCALLLAGCGGGEEAQVTVHQAPVFLRGDPAPFEIRLAQGDEPLTDYQVTATFTMEKMDHGEMIYELTERGEGIYGAPVAVPMQGEWVIDIDAEKDGRTIDRTLTADVRGG
ncbi:FixH family protein [Deinococcus sp. MIMF12]|uniref:FixH family protein n=1 Tax=Deinococcus rhizophilus TaxID=3049544 RepID=A0ABT7JDA0_9DEIO|nr:FixH family protein [Deinococcus rhizophilus]MDL2343036.1 FixH family protein [Deinococcus rhizophilus]